MTRPAEQLVIEQTKLAKSFERLAFSQSPRVQWKAKGGISGSRQKPVEEFPLNEPYPFDLDWRRGC